MLRLEAKAVTLEPDRRGAPVPRLARGGQHSRAGATDHQERFWLEAGLLMLFRRTLQDYSPPKASELAGNLGNVGLDGQTAQLRGPWAV